jgi:hypothetical protein
MVRMIRALLLLVLATSASWAGSAKEKVDDLSGQISRPEDFQSFLEGSLQHQGNPDSPVAPQTAGAARMRSLPALNAPKDRFAQPRLDVPPAPLVSRRDLSSKKDPIVPLAEGMGGVLGVTGLVLALLAGGEPTVKPGRTYAAEPLPRFETPRLKTAPQPSLAPDQTFAGDLPPFEPQTKPYFVDTRMPVPTWRGISLKEQQLIEQWDNSREKSQGLASLSEWVAAKGPAAGIDAAKLQAKLEREA